MMTQELEASYKSTLKKAEEIGFEMLEQGKLAVDAVEAAVQLLEDYHLFNAGKGSVFTANESHEMDPCIMEGKSFNAGAVLLITS